MYSLYQDQDLKYYIFPKDFDLAKVKADNCVFIRTQKNTVVTDFSFDTGSLSNLLGYSLSKEDTSSYIINKEVSLNKPLCFACENKLNYLTKNCRICHLPFCASFKPETSATLNIDLKDERFIKPHLLNENIGKRKIKTLDELSFAPSVVNANRKALKERYELARKQKAKTCAGCVLGCKNKLPKENCYVSKEALDKFLDSEIKKRFGSINRLLKLLSYCHRLKQMDFSEKRDKYRTKTIGVLPFKKDELLMLGKVPDENINRAYFFRQKVKRLKPRYRTFANIETARLVMLVLFIFEDRSMLDPKNSYKERHYSGEWHYRSCYYAYERWCDKRFITTYSALCDTKNLWIDFYYNLGGVKEAKQKVASYQELFRLLPKYIWLDKVLSAVMEGKIV